MTGVAAPAGGRLGLLRAAGAAALAGFACMAAELTAVRVQAPYFGDSAYVWTNVIGVILAALAGGAWLGGSLAARTDAAAWPVRLLVPAGGLVALVPFVAGGLGAWLLPAELPLDAAMPALVRGSLVATALLFAPAMLLLGAIPPLLVSRLAREATDVGRAAGAVGAAGTLGSLAGTFAATHWLVPAFGCRATLAIAGAVLVLAAVLLVGRRRAAASAVAALLAASGGLHGGPLRPPPPGEELLAERESRYQFLQVLRQQPAVGPARQRLVINEGLDSFHSLAIEGSALTGGAYYDWHALAPLLAGDGSRPAGLRVLSIGDAAGTLRAVYAGVHPAARVDGVDIDPACIDLGRAHFQATKASGDLFAIDGRVFVGRATARWHVIHVDAYAHQVYVPTHLASREFFASARERLEPSGVLACNVGALRADDPVLLAIGRSVAAEFGHAYAIQVPHSRNFLLVARKGRPLEFAALGRWPFTDESLGPDDASSWRAIVAAAADPRRWSDASQGGALLCDDVPVLDELLWQGYVDRRERGLPMAFTGRTDPAVAEIQAFEAARRLDWPAVLRAAAASSAATPYLRQLAGDASWSLRELRTAAAEYRAAQALGADEGAQRTLLAKLAEVERQLAPQELAERIAVRNGRLAAAAAAIAAAGLCWLYRMSRMPAAPSVSVATAAR